VAQRTRQRLQEQLARRQEALELGALFMDGVVVAQQTVIVALGITRAGRKEPLGLRLGSTENAVVCTELPEDLLARGLTLDGRVLCVIDLAAALLVVPHAGVHQGGEAGRPDHEGVDALGQAAPGFLHYGLEHFGLTVDNLDAAVTELRAKGAEITVGPLMRNPGLYLAFVRGPEGVMVELVQRCATADPGGRPSGAAVHD
jgi:catechol 2,3-dioxygenase-like lactoylglutathione lyase family enzyme